MTAFSIEVIDDGQYDLHVWSWIAWKVSESVKGKDIVVYLVQRSR